MITNSDYDSSYIITVDDVLKAHYLICEYFEEETGEESLYGIKNYNLLSSAVSRQSVSFGNKFKYETNIEKAATVFYGLVKNHAFHDGNKRTALLSLLYFLLKINRVPVGHQREFENLTENVAGDNYKYYKWDKSIDTVDDKVRFIAKQLNKLTVRTDNSYKALTYRELDTLIHPYGFYLEIGGKQEINLMYKRKGRFGKEKIEKIYQIGFKGWSKQVQEKSYKCIMREIREIVKIDNGTIYRGGEPMYKLIETYSGPLARLRDK